MVAIILNRKTGLSLATATYAIEGVGSQPQGFFFKLTHTPTIPGVNGEIVWDDDDDAQKIRPKTIVMTLSNDVTSDKQTVELSAQNNWTATIENLPTRLNGKPVTYTWTEQEVIGYKLTKTTKKGNMTIFTNSSHKRQNAKGGKNPAGPGETTTIEDYKTPLGVEIVINHVGDCFD